jgi:hypothetical protein
MSSCEGYELTTFWTFQKVLVSLFLALFEQPIFPLTKGLMQSLSETESPVQLLPQPSSFSIQDILLAVFSSHVSA